MIPEHLQRLDADDKGKYYLVTCPQCLHKEAFIWKDYPFRVQCNRKVKCGMTTDLKLEKTMQQQPMVNSSDLESEFKRYKSQMSNSKGEEYLCEKRKITKDVIQMCDVGWDGQESLVYGIRTHEGHLTALKFRNIYTKQMYQKGSNTGTFELQTVNFKDPIIICEGETDLLSLSSYGISNILCARGASWNDKEVDELILQHPETNIALLYDNDPAGEEAKSKAAEKYGFDRCYPIKLPNWTDENGNRLVCKDINDCLVHGVTKEQMIKAISEAEPYPIPGVSTVEQVRDDLKKDPELPLCMFPFQEMNFLTGGLFPGEVSILSGVPKIGKTSLMMGLAKFWARHEDSVVICPLETSKKRLTAQYLQDYTDTGFLNFFEPTSNKLFTDVSRLTKYFKSLKTRFGMKIFVLDHLEWVAQESKDSHMSQIIDTIMKNFVSACKATGTHAVLLHHLRRGVMFAKQDGTVIARKPMIQDLSYAGDKIAANVFFIHRDIDPQTNAMNNTGLAELILSANRANGTTGSVLIEYNKDKGGYVV